jgi:hypothetical protein
MAMRMSAQALKTSCLQKPTLLQGRSHPIIISAIALTVLGYFFAYHAEALAIGLQIIKESKPLLDRLAKV